MGAIAVCVERGVRVTQGRIVRERTQQMVVAAPRFVGAGDDGIHHAQTRAGAAQDVPMNQIGTDVTREEISPVLFRKLFS